MLKISIFLALFVAIVAIATSVGSTPLGTYPSLQAPVEYADKVTMVFYRDKPFGCFPANVTVIFFSPDGSVLFSQNNVPGLFGTRYAHIGEYQIGSIIGGVKSELVREYVDYRNTGDPRTNFNSILGDIDGTGEDVIVYATVTSVLGDGKQCMTFYDQDADFRGIQCLWSDLPRTESLQLDVYRKPSDGGTKLFSVSYVSGEKIPQSNCADLYHSNSTTRDIEEHKTYYAKVIAENPQLVR